MPTKRFILLTVAVLCFPTVGFAALTVGTPASCELDHQIAFEIGQVNPQFTFNDVPVHDQVTVSFGTHFVGQTLGSTANSLADTSPDAPLRLATGGPDVTTFIDLANPGPLVLGGTQSGGIFNTPLAMHFDHQVSHVCFDLGHLDEKTPTILQAFDAEGNDLGQSVNLPAGNNRYSVEDSNDENLIAGISIFVPDGTMDWEGFALRDVHFRIGEENGGTEPMIPEPASILVWGVFALAATLGRRFLRR